MSMRNQNRERRRSQPVLITPDPLTTTQRINRRLNNISDDDIFGGVMVLILLIFFGVLFDSLNQTPEERVQNELIDQCYEDIAQDFCSNRSLGFKNQNQDHIHCSKDPRSTDDDYYHFNFPPEEEEYCDSLMVGDTE